MRLVLALALMAQVACTVGAPAMNDGEATSEALVERITVSTRASLPECTTEREDVQAYIRDEKVVVTCTSEAWRDDANAS